MPTNESTPTTSPSTATADSPKPGPATEASFNLRELLERRQSERHDLYREHINPRFAKVLSTIGFDRNYVRGEGAYLWDDQGTKYLDFLSGYGMFNFGRNHPVVKQAITDYLDANEPWKIQMGATTLPGILAERLLSHAPHLKKVHFTNSGTESVEAALKFARCSTQRERIIYCSRAFHGLTYGSLSLNGCNSFRDGFVSFLPGAKAVPFGDVEALRAELRNEPAAGFFIEPIQGKGVFPASNEYLREAQKLCREYGTKFIVDEIQTGMGRTGTLFAHQQTEGLQPDMILLSKSLSGGMVPVGAVLMQQEIYDKVFSKLDRSVVHSSTFGQGGLAMTCGLASLHLSQHGPYMANAVRQGDRLRAGLQDMVNEFELCHEVRGRGLIIGFELGQPKSIGLRSAWALIHKADAGLFPQALIMPLLDRHHILTQVAGHNMDTIKFLPTLTISDSDVSWFLDAMREVLVECHKFPGPAWSTAKHLIGFTLGGPRSSGSSSS